MRSPPAAITSHYATRKTTMVHALKITRADGTVYGFTEHDVSDTVSGQLYQARPGLNVTSIVIAAGFNVGNLKLRTLHDGTVFTSAEIHGKVWSNAAFQILRYNWASPADGADVLLAGNFGEIEVLDTELEVELRDLRQYLQQAVGPVLSKNCRSRLGVNDGIGGQCPVRLDPPAWQATTAYTVRTSGDAGTGSVVKHASAPTRHFKCTTAGTSGGSAPAWNTTVGGTTADGTVVWTTIYALSITGTLSHVTDKQICRDASRDEPADWFGEGELEWLTGNNAGITAKVKTYAADGTITLALPMLSTVQVGDTYRLVAGCRKRRTEDCRDKFDNILNMDAEPDAPGLDAITAAPESDV